MKTALLTSSKCNLSHYSLDREQPFSTLIMASDKTIILITGANSGIGYETVVALSKASGSYHILLGCRLVEKGQKALNDMKAAYGDSLKGTISILQIDVTDTNSIQAAKDKIEADFGKLDVLINNAGIIVYQDVDKLTALRQAFEANVFGQMMVTETLEPLLKKATKPYIIYVSSEQGSITSRLDPNFVYRQIRGEPYRMSKAALNMLAACHRYNYSEWGWKVLAFNPGWCVTNLTGEKGREMRIRGGARDPKEPANALVDIIQGKRDADIEKNAMVDVDGGVIPW
ncbi:putative short chain dehydrogenase/reductase [Hypoxylon sp. FL1857]|nr:putative short chain dehydrogenase/reductase [Hypoxylon sp. FL1857]